MRIEGGKAVQLPGQHKRISKAEKAPYSAFTFAWYHERINYYMWEDEYNSHYWKVGL